jgi:hypothetical protein
MADKTSSILLSAVQFGLVFLGLAGGYFKRIAPPDDSLRFWPGVATFGAAIAYILVLKVLRRRVQITLFFGALAVSLVLLPLYYREYQVRTASYSGRTVICGTELTPKGSHDKISNQRTTKEELLMDVQGEAAQVWTDESIANSKTLLGVLYSASVGLLALSFLSGIQSRKAAGGNPQTQDVSGPPLRDGQSD